MPQLSKVPVMSRRAPASNDLETLLRRIADKDSRALADLYGHVESRVFAFALGRLGDPDAAADVLHEVMLAVWKTAGSFSGRSRPTTWILGIAHHKIIDVLRKQGRWQGEEADPDLPDVDNPSPFDSAAHGQQQEAVGAALQSLPDGQRQVVHMAFYQELSYPEIAGLLKIPEGTVKTRMFHAKKSLGKRLRPWLFGEKS